jgi:hypothetical protein
VIRFARFTPTEKAAVALIVDRAIAAVPELDRQSLEMDLSCVHAAIPLRLRELAVASEFDFAHDITGIVRHLDRTTGELDPAFLPRYAEPESKDAAEPLTCRICGSDDAAPSHDDCDDILGGLCSNPCCIDEEYAIRRAIRELEAAE